MDQKTHSASQKQRVISERFSNFSKPRPRPIPRRRSRKKRNRKEKKKHPFPQATKKTVSPPLSSPLIQFLPKSVLRNSERLKVEPLSSAAGVFGGIRTVVVAYGYRRDVVKIGGQFAFYIALLHRSFTALLFGVVCCCIRKCLFLDVYEQNEIH